MLLVFNFTIKVTVTTCQSMTKAELSIIMDDSISRVDNTAKHIRDNFVTRKSLFSIHLLLLLLAKKDVREDLMVASGPGGGACFFAL